MSELRCGAPNIAVGSLDDERAGGPGNESRLAQTGYHVLRRQVVEDVVDFRGAVLT